MASKADRAALRRRRLLLDLAGLRRRAVLLGRATLPIVLAAIVGVVLYIPQSQELIRLELQRSWAWLWLYPTLILWAVLVELSALALMRFPYRHTPRVSMRTMPPEKPAYLVSWLTLTLVTPAPLTAAAFNPSPPSFWPFQGHVAAGLLVLWGYIAVRNGRSAIFARTRALLGEAGRRIVEAVGSPKRAAALTAGGSGLALVALALFPARPSLALGTFYSFFLCAALWLVLLTSSSVAWRLSMASDVVTLSKLALAAVFVIVLVSVVANWFGPSDSRWAGFMAGETPAPAMRDSAFGGTHVGGRPSAESRLPADKYIARWLVARQRNGEIAPGADPYPVFLVAAGGGGLRAAVWTAEALGRVEDNSPGFADHVLAMSGVSGGALGLAVFSEVLHRSRTDRAKAPCLIRAARDKFRLCARRILWKDFLAPIITESMTHDILAILTPFIEPRRGQALLAAWGAALKDALGTNGFASWFDSLWTGNGNFWQPALLIGSTHLESGSRVIASNLLIRWPPFYQALDRQGYNAEPVTMGAAVLDSARFAFVSPAGRLVSPGVGTWGHVVDGGYADNSGAYAIDEMMKALVSTAQAAGIAREVMPVVIYISNNMDSRLSWRAQNIRAWELVPPAPLYVQIRAPLLALLAARKSHVRTTVDALDRDARTLCVPMQVFHLERRTVPLPLGWALSPDALHEIAAEAGRNPDIDDIVRLLGHPGGWDLDPGSPACGKTASSGGTSAIANR